MGGTGAGGRRGGSQTGRRPWLFAHGVDLTRGPCPLWRSPFSRPLGRARSTAHMGRPASGKGQTWARHSAVPHCGKKFSIAWKTAKNIFHSVEKSSKNLPYCGKIGLFFPYRGKRALRVRIIRRLPDKSRPGTRAKRGPQPNREKVFHTVENRPRPAFPTAVSACQTNRFPSFFH